MRHMQSSISDPESHDDSSWGTWNLQLKSLRSPWRFIMRHMQSSTTVENLRSMTIHHTVNHMILTNYRVRAPVPYLWQAIFSEAPMHQTLDHARVNLIFDFRLWPKSCISAKEWGQGGRSFVSADLYGCSKLRESADLIVFSKLSHSSLISQIYK
jgi:hypothetical protein